MHTAHIIAQRAPPASRTTKAARWQPYYSQITTCSLSMKSPNLNTPPCPINVSSPHPSLHTPTPSSDIGRSRPQITTPTAQIPKEVLQPDSSKNKFTSGLIDQTVILLSDIWHPHNIPACFLPPVAKTGTSSSSTPSPLQSAIQALKTERTTFPTQAPTPASEKGPGAATSTAALALLASKAVSDQDMLPLRNFVHEVLRRSRTSGNVLQTALCYLEAIRRKVPEILQQENVGIRACFQPESRIQPATQEELEREAELCAMEPLLDESTSEDALKTVRVTDSGPDDEHLMFEFSTDMKNESSFSSTSFTSLPSPLLCPRRAFLASLILASKFSQDKSYSNRAWAKLSGLPPREVGRCERALGQALQWRLWVGKTPVATQPDTPATAPPRSVVRSQSESSLSPSQPFLCEDPASGVTARPSEPPLHKAGVQAGLRRCSTLPADLLVNSSVQPRLDIDNEVNEVDVLSSETQPDDLAPMYLQASPDATTPGLTDSPASTDFSDDRTIPSLEENILPMSFGGNFGKAWLSDSVFHTASPLSFVGGHCSVEINDFQQPVGVVDVDAATYGPNYYWSTDSRLILESAGVH